ncbi:MAG TPA: LD-carboxypeptidase, partial [Vulgatibacter sp.]|nr:LD-carboxypeptidase [Vulgatibacter sp.]
MTSFQPLRSGDTVAVVAPCGPFSRERYERGIALWRERGYRVREFLPAGPWRYLAAADRDRAAALREAWADPEVRAVVVARGGYGAMRILQDVDWDAFASSGKPLVGFSDATAMHLALFAHGAKGVHGPVVTQLGEQPPESVERLFSLLESPSAPPPIAGRAIVGGEASGRLVGGCLSLVAALAGTPFLPSLEGCILLLEEVGEAAYRLDRMWTQLRLSGALEGVAGFAIGSLTDCPESGGARAGEVLAELAAATGRPTLADLPVGHGALNLAVPHGARAAIRGGA